MVAPNLRSRRLRLWLLRILFVIGVCVMAYPFVSNAIYQWRVDRQMAEHQLAVKRGDSAVYRKQREDAKVYNEALVGETVPDVFAIREGTTDAEYESFLNVEGDQVMGSVEIPIISVELPIYHYSTEESLLKGCGHIFGSSLPVGGESVHAVITAHRGLPAAKLFTDLDQLEIGDHFYLNILDERLAYEVDTIEVVAPSETRSLAIQRGEDLVTLVTCTPYGVNTDRLLVRGHRVPLAEGQDVISDPKHLSQYLRTAMQLGCVALGIAAAYGLRKLEQRRRREEKRAERTVESHYGTLLPYDLTSYDGDQSYEGQIPDVDQSYGESHWDEAGQTLGSAQSHDADRRDDGGTGDGGHVHPKGRHFRA